MALNITTTTGRACARRAARRSCSTPTGSTRCGARSSRSPDASGARTMRGWGSPIGSRGCYRSARRRSFLRCRNLPRCRCRTIRRDGDRGGDRGRKEEEEAAAAAVTAGNPREERVRALRLRGSGGAGRAWATSCRRLGRCTGGLTSSSSDSRRQKRCYL
uniref:Uncharacterized protein n=1 Tax=Arundo donax TaxID=35708 RepID=A0A0A9GJV8_ARUDO